MITPQTSAGRTLSSLLIATGFLAAACQAAPIICDTFTRSGGISGSTADTGQIWNGSGWTTSGSELIIPGSSNASVINGLTFVPNTTYVLTMDVSVTSGGGAWIGFGFTTAGGNPASNSRGFMLHRGNQAVQFFTSGTGGQQTANSPSPFPNSLEIQLDTGTTLANSTLTYRLNGVAVGNPVTTNASTINAVFIQNIDNAMGSVDNFVLRESSPLQAYLKATHPNDVDQFGHAVAVSGDTAVIGAYYEDSGFATVQTDNSLTDSGAVYVFVRDGSGNWTEQAYLKPSTLGANDAFGISVDIDGDTIIVGAHAEDSNATGVGGNASNNDKGNSGAAYIFTRTGTGPGATWSQQAYLKASNTDTGDLFGWSVAINGDTAVVGAPRENSDFMGLGATQTDQDDNSLTNAGAAYVFTRSGTSWSQTEYLKASNTGANDQFGWSVALDSLTLPIGLVVGAKGEASGNGVPSDNSAPDSGAAYVFANFFGWGEVAYLKASNIGAGDLFGHSVAIDQGKVIVGAPQEDSGTGAAYIFAYGSSSWEEMAYLKAPNAAAGDQFGYSVGISTCAVAVGAPGEDSSATGSGGDQNDNTTNAAGAVYLFQDDSNNWSFQEYLKASNPGSNDVFGVSLSLDNGILLVGAQGEDSGDAGNPDDNSSPTSGAAYTFDLEAEIAVTLPVDIDLTSGSSTLWHGNELVGASGNSKTLAVCNTGLGLLTDISISVAGSHPGDFVVDDSALNSTLGPCECGSLTVTFSPTAEGVRNATLLIYSNDSDECPFEIELNGIGRSPAGVAEDAYLKASNTEAGDEFGYSVAVSGNTVVIGAPYEDSFAFGIDQDLDNNDHQNSGAVYVYVRDSMCQWSLQATMKGKIGPESLFGHAVSISGDLMAVGAPGASGGGAIGPNAGIVVTYRRSGTTWTEDAELRAFTLGQDDRFGSAVSLSGRWLVVGAPGEAGTANEVDGAHNDGAPDTGAAFVFFRDSPSTWSQEAYLKASDSAPDDQFGYSVGITDESGARTAIVGAPFTGDTGDPDEDEGTAYLFSIDLDNGDWKAIEQDKIKASVPGVRYLFGYSVSIDGNAAVIGAPNQSGAGAAYVFQRATPPNWNQQAMLTAFNADSADQFGYSVSISEDLVVVGANEEDGIGEGVNSGLEGDDSVSASGASYLFKRDGSSWPQESYIKAPNTNSSDEFGTAVAVAEGLVVVGATGEASNAIEVGGDQLNNSMTGAGAGYVYESSLGPDSVLALYNEAASSAGLAGEDALPDAIPFGEGVPNLLKYAFGMDLSGPDVTSLAHGGLLGLPWGDIVEVGNQKIWRYNYVFRHGPIDCIADLYYTALKSPDLVNSWVPFTGTMTMTPISTGWTLMTLEEPYDPVNQRYFYRVEVELP